MKDCCWFVCSLRIETVSIGWYLLCSECCKKYHSLSGFNKTLSSCTSEGCEAQAKVLTHSFDGESSFWHADSFLSVPTQLLPCVCFLRSQEFLTVFESNYLPKFSPNTMRLWVRALMEDFVGVWEHTSPQLTTDAGTCKADLQTRFHC